MKARLLFDTLPVTTFSAHISQSWLLHSYSQEPLADQGIFITLGILTALGVAETTQEWKLNNSLSGLWTEGQQFCFFFWEMFER